MYAIYSRYQYRPNAKEILWTNWFRKFGLYSENKEYLESIIKELKNSDKTLDKYTHLKHEYKIEVFDISTLPVYKTITI